jgi:ribonuclease HI
MPSWVGTATQRVAVGLARTKRTNDCTPGRSGDHHPSARYHLPTTDGDMVADQPRKIAGEAAIGVVLKAPLEEISEPIGPAKDHQVAEYQALFGGVESARCRGIGDLRVCLDSALLVNQLNGRRKVKAEHLKALHRQTVSSMQQIADIKITWVPQRANAEADALASTPPGPRGPSRNLQSTSLKQPSARIARSVRSSPQPLRSTSRPPASLRNSGSSSRAWTRVARHCESGRLVG